MAELGQRCGGGDGDRRRAGSGVASAVAAGAAAIENARLVVVAARLPAASVVCSENV